MAKNYPPNYKPRVERTRKATECQRCQEPTKTQYRVIGSYDEGREVKRATKAGGHWCKSCATKRVKELERQDARRAAKEAEERTPATKKASKPKTKAPRKTKNRGGKPAPAKADVNKEKGAQATPKTDDPF